jgi:predicted transcriptional regulator
MKVLLSIKPEYAEKIFNGTKKFEYRRVIFKNKEVKTIVVYASSPVQKVIGEFDIETIEEQAIEDLWNISKEYSGIDRNYFTQYFRDKKRGYAIKIKSTRRYQKSLCLRNDFNISTPPQSFIYLRS